MQTCCRKLDFEIKSLPVCCFMLVVKSMSSQLPDPVVMPWPLIPSGTINLSQKQQESNWNTWKQAGLAKWPSPQYTFMQGEMHSSHRNGRRATPKLIVFPQFNYLCFLWTVIQASEASVKRFPKTSLTQTSPYIAPFVDHSFISSVGFQPRP